MNKLIKGRFGRKSVQKLIDKFDKNIFFRNKKDGKVYGMSQRFLDGEKEFFVDNDGYEDIMKYSDIDYAFTEGKLNEFQGKPIPMDTPNEFAYLTFKKFAYKNRSQYKKDMQKHIINGEADSSKMFMTASAWWFKWAYKNNKNFSHIKDKLKFGRALMVMMVKDDLVFSKKAWKKNNKITNIKENKRK